MTGIGGIGAALAHRREQTPMRDCPRCGLQTPAEEEACRHCDGLDDAGLDGLRRRIEASQAANRGLGMVLAVVAVLFLCLMIIGLATL